MNCPLLPSTGSSDSFLLVGAMAFIGLGAVILLIGRRRRGMAVAAVVLLGALAAFVVSSGWFVLVTLVWPASSRPTPGRRSRPASGSAGHPAGCRWWPPPATSGGGLMALSLFAFLAAPIFLVRAGRRLDRPARAAPHTLPVLLLPEGWAGGELLLFLPALEALALGGQEVLGVGQRRPQRDEVGDTPGHAHPELFFLKLRLHRVVVPSGRQGPRRVLLAGDRGEEVPGLRLPVGEFTGPTTVPVLPGLTEFVEDQPDRVVGDDAAQTVRDDDDSVVEGLLVSVLVSVQREQEVAGVPADLVSLDVVGDSRVEPALGVGDGGGEHAARHLLRDGAEGAERECPGEAKIAGRATAVPAADGDDGSGTQFTCDISEVVITHLDEAATKLVVEWWTPSAGLRTVERD